MITLGGVLNISGCQNIRKKEQNQKYFELIQNDKTQFTQAKSLIDAQQIGSYQEKGQKLLKINNRETGVTYERLISDTQDRFDGCKNQYRFKWVDFGNKAQVSGASGQIISCRLSLLAHIQGWINYTQDSQVTENIWNHSKQRLLAQQAEFYQNRNIPAIFRIDYTSWNHLIENLLKEKEIQPSSR